MKTFRQIVSLVRREIRYVLKAATSDQQSVEGRAVIFLDGLYWVSSTDSR